MTLSVAVIDALVAAGATAEQLAAAFRADAAEAEVRAERKRANNAERQSRFRDRHREQSNADNALRDVTNGDSVTPPPSPDKAPHTPKINPNPAHTREDAIAPARKPWACPGGVEPQHWSDFLANRRRKKLANTETAYMGQLRLIERFASDVWPPGELVRKAAEKGWGTIVDPTDYEDRNAQRTSNDGRGKQPQNPWVLGLRQAEAREACD